MNRIAEHSPRLSDGYAPRRATLGAVSSLDLPPGASVHPAVFFLLAARSLGA